MTAVGENGRLPPGESWRKAMDQVERARRDGSKRRYRVRGWQVEPGWWAYQVSKVPSERFLRYVAGLGAARPEKPPLTGAQVAVLAMEMPRCAQRAKASHGGETKVAWPSAAMAQRVADALRQDAYRCDLPAPAIGEHWHTATARKRRRRRLL